MTEKKGDAGTDGDEEEKHEFSTVCFNQFIFRLFFKFFFFYIPPYIYILYYTLFSHFRLAFPAMIVIPLVVHG